MVLKSMTNNADAARISLISELSAYTTFDPVELQDKARILELLQTEEKAADRVCPLHLTASCWITNDQMNKVLFCKHLIYKAWSWLGGHADGNFDLAQVALKEAREESGLICKLAANPLISLEILPVAAHMRRGVPVAAHEHANLTYHLLADESQGLRVAELENSELRWFDLDSLPFDEAHMQPTYEKLIARTRLRAKVL